MNYQEMVKAAQKSGKTTDTQMWQSIESVSDLPCSLLRLATTYRFFIEHYIFAYCQYEGVFLHARDCIRASVCPCLKMLCVVITPPS